MRLSASLASDFNSCSCKLQRSSIPLAASKTGRIFFCGSPALSFSKRTGSGKVSLVPVWRILSRFEPFNKVPTFALLVTRCSRQLLLCAQHPELQGVFSHLLQKIPFTNKVASEKLKRETLGPVFGLKNQASSYLPTNYTCHIQISISFITYTKHHERAYLGRQQHLSSFQPRILPYSSVTAPSHRTLGAHSSGRRHGFISGPQSGDPAIR